MVQKTKDVSAPVQPVAIVGMAFRFPGDLANEQQLWQALKDGRDLVSAVPAERWATSELQHPKRSEAGRSITYSAGVLSRTDEFDAEFFGISPREAAWLDPQQRLLLELSWEAMENAGIPASSLSGSDCSVYVGISGFDYAYRNLDDLASMSAYSMTGNTLSLAANRLSYVFDLHGPSLAIDTACSSSLVALHHACNSLYTRESSVSLVGGVNLLSHPFPFVGFTKASMLSASGRCRAFDAAGDGYVRAEGGAVFLLKLLDQALADGDEVHAVILATGANADGSRKTGITIPSGEGQAELMRAVMRRAGIQPDDVDYVEAHGTGTAVGDPIETAAIGAVYGKPRSQGKSLPIGSIKTNLGHLEPASGMAGLVKAILVLKNQAIPASLHFEKPNPNIDFTGLKLEVVTKYRPLKLVSNRPLVAGVNSFGFGGANAHVLVKQFLAIEQQSAAADSQSTPALPMPPLFLSARSQQALYALAARYAVKLRGGDLTHYYDTAYAASFYRDHLQKSLALTAETCDEAADKLERFAQGDTHVSVVQEDKLTEQNGIAFIYSGNGAQWAGMGRQLLKQSPRFYSQILELDAMIGRLAGFSILEELQKNPEQARLDDTAVAQPLLFAIQVALTTILREHGIEPAAVAGHSVGEVAAAWAAGALDLSQAVEVICARSASQALTRGCGRMAAVSLPEADMRKILVMHGFSEIEIVGFNSPSHLTLAGSFTALERLRNILEEQKIYFRLLDLDYAFHSRHMDEIADHLTGNLAHLSPNDANAALFVSSVTGEEMDGKALSANYWWRNVREPVRFSKAIMALAEKGCRIFVEIGPHAILQRYIKESLSSQNSATRVLPTLRRDDDSIARIEDVALRLHMLSDAPKRTAYFSRVGQRVRLPNYPWQRERHWLPQTSEGYHLIERRRDHSLLGWRLKDADATWENILDPSTLCWLADHKVGGVIVLPGAAYVEMGLAIAREWFGGFAFELEELDILSPMVFDSEHARSCRIEFTPRDGSFSIRSRQRLSEDDWVINAAGRLLGAPAKGAVFPEAYSMPHSAIDIAAATHYRLASCLGLDYGPTFQGLEQACLAEDVLQGRFADAVLNQLKDATLILHPAVLDVCFQSLVGFFQREIDAGTGWPLLPVKVGRLCLYNTGQVTSFQTSLVQRGTRSVVADFILRDSAGQIVATLNGCRFRAASLQQREHQPPARWQIVPHVAPLESELHSLNLPAPQALVKHLSEWFTEHESRLKRSAYFMEMQPLFDALTLGFAYRACEELAEKDKVWFQQVCSDPSSINENVRPLVGWLLGQLQQEGLLLNQDGAWYLQATDLPPVDEIWRTLLRDYSHSLPELVQIGRIGLNLFGLITGKVDAQDLAQQLAGSHVAETYHTDSAAYQGTQLAVKQILMDLATAWPANRRLRVLEITSGQSKSIHALTAHFDCTRLDYVLSSLDAVTHAQLNAELQHQSHVTVASLQADNFDLHAETPLPEHFDVIVLQHCLHGVANPRTLLVSLHGKLAAGGLLLLAERHPDLNANFMFGVQPQWWHETSGLAPVSQLMPPGVWHNLLAEQHFESIETWLEPASQGAPVGAFLLLAKQVHSAPLQENLPSTNWLLLTDGAASAEQLASRLASHLESAGHNTQITCAREIVDCAVNGEHSINDTVHPGSQSVVLANAQLGGIQHVVYLVGRTASSTCDDDTKPALDFFNLIRHLANLKQDVKLWLVAPGGALVTYDSMLGNPVTSSLWGLGRVVMNEYPHLALRLIDPSADITNPQIISQLASELLKPDAETEILLTEEARYGLRLEQVDTAPTIKTQTEPRFRLDFIVPGQLRNLKWLPATERPLNDDEVEVKTVATGLNFRDVMYLMGLLPDEAVEKGFAGASLGLECAGIVSRVGNGVRNFTPGDAVMGFGASCFSSHVITRANALAHKPAEWSFESAATVPTVFFTVYYALKHLANLQPGERVLIHGGAGGVGIAAIQMARYLGAEIYATAGSEEKRDFVRLLGADHVLDSRSLDYAQHILELTGGEGVDVVLNSLAGEAIRRNLQVLKPFGRFLELGKRDFFENTPIGLRPFKDNISYFGIDADQLLIARPELAGRLFREVMALFSEGVLAPLPFRAFTTVNVVDAFRCMQQSRHIGKIVVTHNITEQVPHIDHPVVKSALHLPGNTTWLITGGIAGFGLESARWLARHGASHLVLLGRRGMQTPGAEQLIQEFQAQGVRVEIRACDVSQRESLQIVLNEIQHNLPPLRGVLHAAMVLDDALMANLDSEHFANVLAAKLTGAKNLHELTRHIPLDHFVMYSSVTTLIGNPGQANYVTANAYLEGLASQRKREGLPALCIGWGPIGDAGYLTRNEAVKESLAARLGAAPLATTEALSALEQLLMSDVSSITVANFEWKALERLLPSSGSTRFTIQRKLAGQSKSSDINSQDFRSLISGKTTEEITHLVQKMVTDEVAHILCMEPERIDATCSLHDLGLDSLMGVELALGLEKRCGIQMPAMMLNEGPSVARITMRIVEKIAAAPDNTGIPADNNLNTLVLSIAEQHGESMDSDELAQTVRTVEQKQQLSQSVERL